MIKILNAEEKQLTDEEKKVCENFLKVPADGIQNPPAAAAPEDILDPLQFVKG